MSSLTHLYRSITKNLIWVRFYLDISTRFSYDEAFLDIPIIQRKVKKPLPTPVYFRNSLTSTETGAWVLALNLRTCLTLTLTLSSLQPRNTISASVVSSKGIPHLLRAGWTATECGPASSSTTTTARSKFGRLWSCKLCTWFHHFGIIWNRVRTRTVVAAHAVAIRVIDSEYIRSWRHTVVFCVPGATTTEAASSDWIYSTLCAVIGQCPRGLARVSVCVDLHCKGYLWARALSRSWRWWGRCSVVTSNNILDIVDTASTINSRISHGFPLEKEFIIGKTLHSRASVLGHSITLACCTLVSQDWSKLCLRVTVTIVVIRIGACVVLSFVMKASLKRQHMS